jgi:two-component system nitrogen regulation response regulator GlnG
MSASRNLDTSTLKLERQAHPQEVAPRRLLLTIVMHPSLQRIGQRVELAPRGEGEALLISRTTPEFRTPEGRLVGPLDDPYISRSPVILRSAGGILRLDSGGAAARIMDLSAAELPQIDARALARGVLLRIAERVVLLLEVAARADDLVPRYGLVGDSAAIHRVRCQVNAVAGLDVPVLIRGESGTGKELVARALHTASARSARPFVSINMAALPPQMAAAELFGHARGSFTGAVGSRAGYFRDAHGGTLFLDEIGEAPIEVQALLLRTLETGEVQALGGAPARRVDVRVIAATDADLETMAQDGGFRPALYHRLAAYELMVPALRERREDIPRLLVHFLEGELHRAGEAALVDRLRADASRLLPLDVMVQLLTSRWPGNVRELGNAARRLAVALISGHDPRGAIAGSGGPAETNTDAGFDADPAAGTEATHSPTAVTQLSDGALMATLEDHGWQIAAAARSLGVSRSTLYARIRRSRAMKTARELPRDELADLYQRHHGDLAAMSAEARISARALHFRLQALGLLD